jgi:hypothetical protein
MTDVFNSSGKPTFARQTKFGLTWLRKSITSFLPARRAVLVSLDDEANQLELLRLAHRHHEEIRRGGDELRLLGVRR